MSDLGGDVFGKWTVLERHTKWWNCKCACGAIKLVRANNLKRGKTKSCGCVKVKHGLTNSKLYTTWNSMIQRCTNSKNISYPHYGGRGILVCEEWQSFSNFHADMGDLPEGLTLERIDITKGYSKSNCRWATVEEQANNKSTNHINYYQGQRYTLAQASRKFNVKQTTLRMRLKTGWSFDEAVGGGTNGSGL